MQEIKRHPKPAFKPTSLTSSSLYPTVPTLPDELNVDLKVHIGASTHTHPLPPPRKSKSHTCAWVRPFGRGVFWVSGGRGEYIK